MSIIDGTTSELKCGLHDFVTTNLDEWNKHLSEPGHYMSGTCNCIVCGKPYTFAIEDKVSSMRVLKGMVAHPRCPGEEE